MRLGGTSRKQSILVIDNFLTENENNQIIQYYKSNDFIGEPLEDKTVIPVYFSGREKHRLIDRMIDACFFDSYDGYEFWFNNPTTPIGFHFDTDQALEHKTGEIRHPSLSLVYYPDVNINGGGGGLVIKDHAIIEAKKGRLVAFDSTLQHGVSDFIGTRLSLVVNIWKQKPLGIEAISQKVCYENQSKESVSSQQF
ncbi:MAG: 2OG-Fe(II) oxygenase [Betaproteobacteria bacterium]